jgi:hypothetical protein
MKYEIYDWLDEIEAALWTMTTTQQKILKQCKATSVI